MGNINFRGKINLAALPSHRIMQFKNSENPEEPIEAIVIPLKKNNLFKSEKGNVYLDIIGFEQQKPMTDKDGGITQTHIIKQSLPKDVREKMTNEEKMAQPIVGSAAIIVFETQEKQAVQDQSFASSPEEDDLPF